MFSDFLRPFIDKPDTINRACTQQRPVLSPTQQRPCRHTRHIRVLSPVCHGAGQRKGRRDNASVARGSATKQETNEERHYLLTYLLRPELRELDSSWICCVAYRRCYSGCRYGEIRNRCTAGRVCYNVYNESTTNPQQIDVTESERRTT